MKTGTLRVSKRNAKTSLVRRGTLILIKSSQPQQAEFIVGFREFVPAQSRACGYPRFQLEDDRLLAGLLNVLDAIDGYSRVQQLALDFSRFWMTDRRSETFGDKTPRFFQRQRL